MAFLAQTIKMEIFSTPTLLEDNFLLIPKPKSNDAGFMFSDVEIACRRIEAIKAVRSLKDAKIPAPEGSDIQLALDATSWYYEMIDAAIKLLKKGENPSHPSFIQALFPEIYHNYH